MDAIRSSSGGLAALAPPPPPPAPPPPLPPAYSNYQGPATSFGFFLSRAAVQRLEIYRHCHTPNEIELARKEFLDRFLDDQVDRLMTTERMPTITSAHPGQAAAAAAAASAASSRHLPLRIHDFSFAAAENAASSSSSPLFLLNTVKTNVENVADETVVRLVPRVTKRARTDSNRLSVDTVTYQQQQRHRHKAPHSHQQQQQQQQSNTPLTQSLAALQRSIQTLVAVPTPPLVQTASAATTSHHHRHAQQPVHQQLQQQQPQRTALPTLPANTHSATTLGFMPVQRQRDVGNNRRQLLPTDYSSMPPQHMSSVPQPDPAPQLPSSPTWQSLPPQLDAVPRPRLTPNRLTLAMRPSGALDDLVSSPLEGIFSRGKVSKPVGGQAEDTPVQPLEKKKRGRPARPTAAAAAGSPPHPASKRSRATATNARAANGNEPQVVSPTRRSHRLSERSEAQLASDVDRVTRNRDDNNDDGNDRAPRRRHGSNDHRADDYDDKDVRSVPMGTDLEVETPYLTPTSQRLVPGRDHSPDSSPIEFVDVPVISQKSAPSHNNTLPPWQQHERELRRVLDLMDHSFQQQHSQPASAPAASVVGSALPPVKLAADSPSSALHRASPASADVLPPIVSDARFMPPTTLASVSSFRTNSPASAADWMWKDASLHAPDPSDFQWRGNVPY